MSTSAGIGGAFGLLLPKFPKVAAIYGELKLVVNQALDREVAAEPGELEGAMEVLQIRDRLIGAFAEDGILCRRRLRCSGPVQRQIAWLAARPQRMSGFSDSAYSRTRGTIRQWMRHLGRAPASIPGRGWNNEAYLLSVRSSVLLIRRACREFRP